jgi:hypothetical protein
MCHETNGSYHNHYGKPCPGKTDSNLQRILNEAEDQADSVALLITAFKNPHYTVANKERIRHKLKQTLINMANVSVVLRNKL